MNEPYLDAYSSPEFVNPGFEADKKIKNKYSLRFAFDPVHYINTGGSRNRLENIALFGALSKVRYMVPYLDYRVIDYAVSIPRYLYFCGKTRRYIFRETFKDIMPESLYRLSSKDTPSYNSMGGNPNWYEKYVVRKKEIIEKLDREYWKHYLNFEMIDKLAGAGKPSDEEYDSEVRHLKILLKFGLAQNLVDLSRGK